MCVWEDAYPSVRSRPVTPLQARLPSAPPAGDSSSAAALPHTEGAMVLKNLRLLSPEGQDPSPGWTSGCGVTVSSSVKQSRRVS